MRTGSLAALVAATAIMTGAGMQMLTAQAARSYTWYAELSAVDPAARTVTIKTQIREGVTRYVGSYKAGDKLTLTWTPIKGESDTVIYAPKREVMKDIDEGFILPAEFVAADVAGKTLTVKIAASPAVLQALQAVKPGQSIKAVTPMKQPAETAMLTSAAAAPKPDLKPPAPPPAATTTDAGAGRGRGRGAAPAAPAAEAAGASGGIAGAWTVTSSLGGNSLTSECTFVVEGEKLSGGCKGPLGDSPLSGSIKGADVFFSFTASISGMSLDFSYGGVLEGREMKGSVTVYGMTAPFSATKK